MPFKWLEFAFECFEPCLKGSNLHSNALNWIEQLEFALECFEFLSNGSNLHSNASIWHSHALNAF